MESGILLRERRLALALTQAQLASRAQVSRQLVAAVEAGRNMPAVDTALRLATVLETTVEALFAPPPGPLTPASVLGGELTPGAPLRVGRVGAQLVAAELPRGAIAGDLWAVPDATITDGELEFFPGARAADLVVGGCDPALGIAEAMFARPHRMLAVSASTGIALPALARGTLHAAVVHGPVGKMPQAPLAVVRWHLARWQVGLALGPRIGSSPSLEEILHSDTPLVVREPQAASQQALERARVQAGLPSLTPSAQASAHLQAARIAAERDWSAVTTAGAARSFGLEFVALEDHTVEIWIAAQWIADPAVQALGELLAGEAFTSRVAHLGGYDLAGCGTTLS